MNRRLFVSRLIAVIALFSYEKSFGLEVPLELQVGAEFSRRFHWQGEASLAPSDYAELFKACVDYAPGDGRAVATVRMDLGLAVPQFPNQEVLQFEMSAIDEQNRTRVMINYVESAQLTGTSGSALYSTLVLPFSGPSTDICFKIYGWPFIGTPLLNKIVIQEVNLEVQYDR